MTALPIPLLPPHSVLIGLLFVLFSHHSRTDRPSSQHSYRGRPLAFLTEAERREIGGKISEGLRRYHEQKRLQAL